MTQFTSYLADLTDSTFATREVDLNGSETGFGIFEIDESSFDLGAPGLDATWLSEEGVDDDVMSSHRRPHVESSFNLRIDPGAGTYQNLVNSVRSLNHALDRFGVWVLKPPGQADTLYIDYYPSPLVSQFQSSERNLFHLFTQLQSPSGMPLTILRRAKMRGALLAASLNLVHNGTLAEDHDNDGIPSLWAWDSRTGLSGDAFNWRFGAYQVTAAATVAAHAFQQVVTGIAVGTTYTFAWEAAAAYTAQPSVWARIEWLDAGSTVLSTVNGTTAATVFSPTLGFISLAASGVAPASTVSARVSLMVQPTTTATTTLYLRSAQLEVGSAASAFRAGTETVSNDPAAIFGKRLWVRNSGNTDAIGQLDVTPGTGTNVVRLGYSRRSGFRNSVASMAVLKGWHAVSSTALMNGTTSVVDANAAGGNAAKTAGISTVLKPILRHEALQTDDTALRGTWRLIAAIRGDVGSIFELEGHYGLGDVVDLPFPMDTKTLDLTDPTASEYLRVDLGLFRIPADTDGFFFELWCKRTSGGGQLYVDVLWPEPADDRVNANAVIPGLPAPQGTATITYLGAGLVTPPAAPNPWGGHTFTAGFVSVPGDMVLNDQWDAAAIDPAATDTLSAVKQTFSADINMFTALVGSPPALPSPPVKHGELRVHDLTSNTQILAASCTPAAGVQWSQKTVTAIFTPVAGHAYVIYVVLTMNVAATPGNIHIIKITQSFVPPADGSAGDAIHIDAFGRRAYVTQGGVFKDDLDLTPPFPTFEPGLQLIRLGTADQVAFGYQDALPGDTAVKHVSTSTFLAGANLIPRWTN